MAFDIAVLISGNGSNLQAIIDAVQLKKLTVSIKVVISDRADAKGLQRARKANINTEILDPALYSTRELFDDALSALLHQHQVQLTVLAGFMRILSDKFVNQYLGSLINIHPSLLPKYKGLNTHQRVLDAGESEHGASVHFVTPTLDDGPIILQSSITILKENNCEQLKQQVHTIEHIIYPLAIAWISENRIELKNQQVYLDGIIISKQNRRYKIIMN